MFDTSEAAMDANVYLSFGRAAAEIRRHGMSCKPVAFERDTHKPEIMVWDGHSRTPEGWAAWDTIPCTSKAILEWLGY